MRVSREAAAESRNRIIKQASRLMRENGVGTTSLADAMHAAGMTTGGFYKHFSSKDELAREAVREAFAGLTAELDRNIAQAGAPAARAAYFENYLSPAHIRNPGKGCPVASMGTDAARQAEVLGPEYAAGLEAMMARLASGADAQARADLIAKMSLLIGAVILARSVGNSPLRREIITSAKAALDQPGRAK